MATFGGADRLGPLVRAGRVNLSGAVFGAPVTLSIAARRLECRRTRWLSTAEARLRYATVDFSHAVFGYPLTIAVEPEPFVLTHGRQLAEAPLTGAPDAAVRMASLRGVDAARLVLADVDLSATGMLEPSVLSRMPNTVPPRAASNSTTTTGRNWGASDAPSASVVWAG